ncbi:MAG: hypothetical protein AB7V77_05495, partial [Candidatus Woesearchaeota archaeon]
VDLIYLNYNDVKNSSIYIFAIGSKKKTKWKKIINDKNNKIKNLNNFIGKNIIKNNIYYKFKLFINKLLKINL